MTERLALRVAIGPVQGWIAAGRRTRDFWAGSFLLSWLSGQAMAAVLRTEGGGGEITIPAVGPRGDIVEPTLRAILARPGEAPRPGPLVGTLVNHFRAEVNPDFEPQVVKNAVHDAFQKLSEAVWDYFFENAAKSYGWDRAVKDRWDFQTDGSYFDILWVMGPANKASWKAESRWLERRKTLRTHALPVEPGAKGDPCPVHPELRELGGFFRANERPAQDKFWHQVRQAVANGVYGDANGTFIETLEIREGERLSALALVKRLFPLLPPDKLSAAIGWVPDHLQATPNVGDTDGAWRADAAQRALRNWPSTAFVAAIPWIVEVGHKHPDEADRYAGDQYRALGIDAARWRAETPQRHRVAGIDALGKGRRVPLFAVLDGTLHFERGLEKHRHGDNEARSATLQQRFRDLVKVVKPIGKPASFYAMLEMDGDNMGQLFSSTKDRAVAASTALLNFAAGIPEIVRNHDGVLIYAGADDVNAMLPMATSIDCAREIRKHWTSVMAGIANADGPAPTLSGSILFCDYQNALDDMRRLAHSRLDGVAKDAMGRDALAVAVAKSGGVAAEWASRWEDKGGARKPEEIVEFAEAAANSATVASRLAYVLRDRFAEILENDSVFDDELLTKLLAKELRDSGLAVLGKDPEKNAAVVVHLLQPAGAYAATPGDTVVAPRHVGGLLVARFLAASLAWSYLDHWRARQADMKANP